MNFLDFVNNKNNKIKNASILNEAFKDADVDKAHKLMLSIFKKKISKNTVLLGWLDQTIASNRMRSAYFLSWKKDGYRAFSLNYLIESESANVYSVSLFNKEQTSKLLFVDGIGKATLTINTLGTSVAYFIPIICHIIKNDDFGINKEQAEKLGSEIFNKGKQNESYIWNYGAAKYEVYEHLSEETINDMFYLNSGYVQEAVSREAQDYRWKKRNEKIEAWNKHKLYGTKETKAEFEKLNDEYNAIVQAIRGGAETIHDIKMHLAKNITVRLDTTESERKAQEKINTESKDPEQAFKETSVYIKTVIKGLQPGLIICGAPGVGKTFKVMKQLEAAGYHDGHNMEVIKGKCTPRQLYLSLYNYKEKGNIIVIDDADALVGPKAPEECINMLKAALDSTSSIEGRKVTYRVTGNILDDEGNEIPKTIYYKGGVIVITNYSVGQLDTALRGRSFVQELDFSNTQILKLLEGMIDTLGEGLISMSAKHKALEYLTELAETSSEMEISIRTFNTCARLFEVCKDDPDMTDTDVKSMIKEQMKNQYLRGGQKF